ncbi:MAG: hypothetical protein LBH58_04710 [Tannerellaceae bacterium]|jgi:hypothetical protein|nr:hypothetical protein [Tannerellaceae bacterium]
MADHTDDVREKMTVTVCTKCLRKKSVIIPSIVTFFFAMSLLGNIIQTPSEGEKAETSTIVVVSVITLACLFWTGYKIFRIVTDNPLSEASAAKKLIRKARKANPAKFYFTPAENALSATRNKKQKSAGGKNLGSDTIRITQITQYTQSTAQEIIEESPQGNYQEGEGLQ